MDSVKQVAVVGGGWAGLSAAIEATRLGHRVTLFEMAPQLGGRARSVDVSDELQLDNGQHILIGAYVETLRLMRVVGVDERAAFVRRRLEVVDPLGRGLRLGAGPPVVAFGLAVLRQRDWSWNERVRLLTTAVAWACRGFRCPPMQTVEDLCAALPRGVRDGFIDPLCVAALNTPSSDASGSVFLRVIRDALFAGPGSSDLLLPRLRLGELLPAPAHRWLQQHGADIRLTRRVDQLERAAGTSARWCVDGQAFDHVILATTPTEAARLCAAHAPQWAKAARSLRYEPIVTVYAQSDGTSLPCPMLMLPSNADRHPAQFVFDHGALGGRPGLLAFVISGAAAWVERGMDATRDAVLDQAREQLETRLRSPLIAIRTLTEKRATFRCTPGLRRPSAAILPGLHAAGDHVDGPYPATLEGAVRAGVSAARAVA